MRSTDCSSPSTDLRVGVEGPLQCLDTTRERSVASVARCRLGRRLGCGETDVRHGGPRLRRGEQCPQLVRLLRRHRAGRARLPVIGEPEGGVPDPGNSIVGEVAQTRPERRKRGDRHDQGTDRDR